MKRAAASLLSLCLWLAAAPASALHVEPEAATDHTMLILTGEFAKGDATRLEKALKKYIYKNPIQVILTSIGGDGPAVEPLFQVLNKYGQIHQRRYSIPLVFVLDLACGSACTLLTAKLTNKVTNGSVRILTMSETDFALHGPILYRNGKELSEAANPKLYKEFTDKVVSDYSKAGMNPEWLKYVRERKWTHFQARELCVGKSLIIPEDSCQADMEALVETVESIMAQKKSPGAVFKGSLLEKLEKARQILQTPRMLLPVMEDDPVQLPDSAPIPPSRPN